MNARESFILSADGELQTLPHERARTVLHKQAVMVCHAPYVRGRLGLEEFYAWDVLELFAFVHPGKFCVPTPLGLAKALGLAAPSDAEDLPFLLLEIAEALLADLKNDPWKDKADPVKIAGVMGLQGKGWAWTPFIFAALGQVYDPAEAVLSRSALNVWKHLPEWAEEAPEPPPSHHAVSADESRERLAMLLGTGAEERAAQAAYAEQVAEAFAPPLAAPQPDDNTPPHVILAEAGTGVGKTLGYIAPASVWAEKNKGSVWIATYTKNLQRQIDTELDRLYPNPETKEHFVTVRKGRENYLCLLNLEDAAAAAGLARTPGHAVAAGIMARWAAATKDGDLSGADFPGWLGGLLGTAQTLGLADRRGECVYSACDHYHRCFSEKSIRRAKRARLVIANHALVMVQAALAGPEENLPQRYVFDEGHHIFDAADSAFAAHLTARETRDLRRWILGAEGGRRSRARGLKRRAEDLAAGDAEAEKTLQAILHHAHCLTGEGWAKRLRDSEPKGPTEEFLLQLYRQVYARSTGREGPYSLETEAHPADPALLEKARTLRAALEKLQKPMRKLAALLHKKLAADEGHMDGDTRKRLDSVAIALRRRSDMMLAAWMGMLEALAEGPPQAGRTDFVDWMEIERIDGRAVDVGLFRHWKDPMKPFAAAIAPHVQGMAVTSATLRDGSGAEAEGWTAAIERTGARYLSPDPQCSSFASPFDYAAQTKIFIINDVRKDDLAQVAGAYQALFKASGGGALGLFTAISRLRAVHGRIAGALEDAHIPLYAQHVDAIDPGTLVDMFRDDIHACLLGTDAVRDGVDVPGESLRLIVFDRVPWPRPTILHKARREAFGGRRYDETMTRLRLKQAFGRLIRRAGDKGVFVMLDPMLPSRLQDAFPDGVAVRKCDLAEAAGAIGEFLG